MLSAINVCRVCFIGALVFFYSLEASGTAAFAQIGAIGTLPQFDVTHLAGGPGGAGYLDGPASQARFSGPSGIWVVAETCTSRIPASARFAESPRPRVK